MRGFFAMMILAAAVLGPAIAGAQEVKYSKPPRAELQKKLTRLQFEVTQEEGTEPAFFNEFWNNHQAGIYVDIVSGEPLFSSTDKYRVGHRLAELRPAPGAGQRAGAVGH